MTPLFAFDDLSDGPAAPRLAAAVVMVLLLIPVVWALLGSRHDFAVRVDRAGRVSFKGRFPARYRAAVTEFFRQQAPPQRVKVYGSWSGGRLRLRVTGVASSGDAQRVRNFLMATLRP